MDTVDTKHTANATLQDLPDGKDDLDSGEVGSGSPDDLTDLHSNDVVQSMVRRNKNMMLRTESKSWKKALQMLPFKLPSPKTHRPVPPHQVSLRVILRVMKSVFLTRQRGQIARHRLLRSQETMTIVGEDGRLRRTTSFGERSMGDSIVGNDSIGDSIGDQNSPNAASRSNVVATLVT